MRKSAMLDPKYLFGKVKKRKPVKLKDCEVCKGTGGEIEGTDCKHCEGSGKIKIK